MDKRVALITGGSAGLGLEIATTFLINGYRVAIVGRNQDRLDQARQTLFHANKNPGAGLKNNSADDLLALCGDLSEPSVAQTIIEDIVRQWGRLDVVINNVGLSDRGSTEELTTTRFAEIIAANTIPMLLTSQAALPHLEKTQGAILNIGSLAGKVGARYLGAYPAAKHALAGLTQQMRLEWKPRGVHVALLSPGPIRRADAGERYEAQVAADGSLPQQAKLPGGGTRVKGLPPTKVAQKALWMVQKRSPDVLMPWHMRPLVGIGNLWPRLGDWLLLKFTSVRKNDSTFKPES